MVTPILMPALSPTMTEGTITKWLKVEGDSISAGDLLAEIETDKATMELEAVEDGELGKIIKLAGDESIKVNELIAVILEDGEDRTKIDEFVGSLNQENSKSMQPTLNDSQATMTTEINDRSNNKQVAKNLRKFASPLARRLASNAGLQIEQIEGSGPHGRVTKRDVEALIANTPAKKEIQTTTQSEGFVPAIVNKEGLGSTALTKIPNEAYTELPHSKMRKVIANRLTTSSQEVPHFFLTIECEIVKLLEMREELNKRSVDGEDSYKISVNDFVIAAVALAIKKVPMVNVRWTDEAMLQLKNVDISFAVATEGGLITPIIRNADQKGLSEIAIESKELVKKARSGKLTPDEYQGGSFTISNLGMYGIKEFAAIINQPQSCILAVGAGEKRPVIKNGALAIANIMSCTLSVDHRAVDGALGAQYLQVFKSLVEDPLTMIL